MTTVRKNLRRATDAGYRAFYEGEPVTANPWLFGDTRLAAAWTAGWWVGQYEVGRIFVARVNCNDEGEREVAVIVHGPDDACHAKAPGFGTGPEATTPRMAVEALLMRCNCSVLEVREQERA